VKKRRKPDESDRVFLGRALLLYAGTGSELPDWGKQALKELLAPQQKANKRLWARWRAVRTARRRGLTWEKAYQAASDELAGTPYAGKAREMKRAYLERQTIARKWPLPE
jgi:hypothetical protein